MDLLQKIGKASEDMAECALAMQMAGEKAVTAARSYEDLTAECEKLGMPSETYREIANIFRGIEAQNQGMDFSDLIKMCLAVSEVTR